MIIHLSFNLCLGLEFTFLGAHTKKHLLSVGDACFLFQSNTRLHVMGTHLTYMGIALLWPWLWRPTVTWNGVFWRKWKRKGTDKHQRIQCSERKAPHRGLVKSIKGSIRLWNFLSQPISARSRVNKPPGLSNMHIWLLIAANWQFAVRLWQTQSTVVTAK